jgi:ATP-dependent helicase/DNAse subunit B
MPSKTRQERRALRKDGVLDTTAFLKLAGKFIDAANRENQRIPATDVHMALLWAAARYNAHVAKAVLDVANHEQFVKEMAEEYTEMLRQHLADPDLDPARGSTNT